MLELQVQMLQYACSRTSPRESDWSLEAIRAAVHLYDRARWRARLARWRSALTRRSSRLLNLSTVRATGQVCGSHYAGLCTVPIYEIRGSECRAEDFDARFYPLQRRSQARWVSIATAYQMGIPMPPVELIKVDDSYYVQDGHHRISVARALGQEYIEARVTVWDVSAQPASGQLAAVSRSRLELSEVGVSGGCCQRVAASFPVSGERCQSGICPSGNASFRRCGLQDNAL